VLIEPFQQILAGKFHTGLARTALRPRGIAPGESFEGQAEIKT
jgi:hypothetical protein